MKILFSYLIVLAILLFSFQVRAQYLDDNDENNSNSTSRNSFELNLGTGFGMYGMKDDDPNSDAGAAVTGLLHAGGSYYISHRFSAGILFERLGFLTNKDSSQQKAKAFNVGLVLKYLPMVKERSSIYLHFIIGTCSFKYNNLKTNTLVNAGSYFFEPGVGFNHYWSKHIGFYLSASYFYTKFSKLVNKDNTPLTITNKNGGQENFWLALSGMNFNLGLVYKL